MNLLPAFAHLVKKTAVIDDSGRYRYLLTRRWGKGAPCLFVMLNPSTATAEVDDPTIRKCIGFAKHWKYPAIEVVNLFAYRSKDPWLLRMCRHNEPPIDPVGPENNKHILAAAKRASFIVAAWGNDVFARDRGKDVMEMMRTADHKMHALGVGKSGQPYHPLYIPYERATEIYHGNNND